MATPVYSNTFCNFVIVIPEKNKLQILASARDSQLSCLFALQIN